MERGVLLRHRKTGELRDVALHAEWDELISERDGDEPVYEQLSAAEADAHERVEQPSGDEEITPGLLASDYEAGSAENIATLVSHAPLETAQAVLAYEQAHKDRVTVTRAAAARIEALQTQ